MPNLQLQILLVLFGIFLLEPAVTGQQTRIKFDRISIAQGLSQSTVRCILQDSRGFMWFGTGDGLNKYDGYKFTRFKCDPEDTPSLSDKSVLSILEDGNGILWIGTFGGLNKFDQKNQKFSRCTEKNGLPNNVIYGISEDTQGFLWLSANKGISKFDPQTESFKIYDMKDGLQGNEFNQGAYYQNENGEIFFGGNNGFNAFFPEKIIYNPHIPPVLITDFQIFNYSVEPGENSLLKFAISETEKIKLHQRHQNVFSFEFAALDFSAPEKNLYAYKMEGFEKEWIHPKSRRFVTYTNLPAGNYVFRVRGSNNNGVWNEDGATIRIKIIPPSWKTHCQNRPKPEKLRQPGQGRFSAGRYS